MAEPGMAKTIHVERSVAAPVERVMHPFRGSRGLARWWDPTTVLSRYKVGGTATASHLPGFEIVAIVPGQLIAHRYTSVIDGLGLWSFVSEGRKRTRLILDHVAAGNVDDEAGRTFYWQGLVENLAAVAEGRPIPFVNGEYSGRKLPKGVRHRTMDEFVSAWKPRA